MSDAETSYIHATLDRLGAPEGATIAERIEGLYRELGDAAAQRAAEAMTALNAADVYTTGTLAHGIAYLAEQRNIATSRAIAAERATLRERQCAEQARAALHTVLDGFKAPPGDAISERIRGLVGPAAAALHDAGFVVGEGTLGEAITAALADAKTARTVLWAYAGDGGTLAAAVRYIIARHVEAIRQRDEQLLIRGRAETREVEALNRAEVAESALREERERCLSATIANRELLADLASQRAEVARLSAQLDYASEQVQAALRRGA